MERRIEGLENFKEIVGKFITRLGDPSKYEFRGEVIDLGEYGRGKCTCDHPVRYMLLIWGPNGEVAPVGCECIKHFAAYNDALYNKLEGARIGLMEALAAEEREKAEAIRQAERSKLQPAYELARRRFLTVCKMHQDNINLYLPRAMWTLKADLMKKVEYKTTNGYLKFYTRMTLAIEKTLGMYERGELW
jgi:Cu2+-containing amine oxidase